MCREHRHHRHEHELTFKHVDRLLNDVVSELDKAPRYNEEFITALKIAKDALANLKKFL